MDEATERESPQKIRMEVQYITGVVENWEFYAYEMHHGFLVLCHSDGTHVAVIRMDQVMSIGLQPGCVRFGTMWTLGYLSDR